MSKPQYIKPAAIKRIAKQHGKRVGTDFLIALDGYIERKVKEASIEHNGGRKTLDAALAAYFLGTR